jgi:hypothetical protein
LPVSVCVVSDASVGGDDGENTYPDLEDHCDACVSRTGKEREWGEARRRGDGATG